jgi:DHA1 family tetracycline resistance protein-like MFS transporter
MTPTTSTTAGTRGRALLPLIAVNFLSSLGFSVVMPFLVFLVTGLGGNAFAMGVVGASFSLSQLVGAPWLGGLSDRVGRRRVLLYSQLGGLLAWAIFALALLAPRVELLRVDSRFTGSFVLLLPLALILVSRATDGLVNGSISVANAYLADVTTEEERKGAFARLGAATSLGFVIGPLAAGFLARGERGVMVLVLIAAALSVVGAFVVWRYLPAAVATAVAPASAATLAGVHKALGGGSKECVGHCAPASLRAILAVPDAKRVIALYFLVFLGFSIFSTALPVHALRDLGWSSDRLGTLFGALSLTLITTQALVLPPLSRRVSSTRLATAGSALVAAAYALLASSAGAGAFVAVALYGVGNGLLWPSYLAILSETGPAWMRGRLQGVASSAGSIASIAGMLGAGSALETFGKRTFLVGAAALLLAAGMFAVKRDARAARAA